LHLQGGHCLALAAAVLQRLPVVVNVNVVAQALKVARLPARDF
jgi:hypothetical protein